MLSAGHISRDPATFAADDSSKMARMASSAAKMMEEKERGAKKLRFTCCEAALYSSVVGAIKEYWASVQDVAQEREREPIHLNCLPV